MKYRPRGDYPPWLRLALGNNFYSLAAQVAAVAAQFSCLQLFNPVASSTTVVVWLIDFGGVASPCEIRWNNTPLTTLIGTGVASRGGVAVSQAQLYKDNLAAIPGTLNMHFDQGIAFSTIPVMQGLFILDPGVGLQIN